MTDKTPEAERREEVARGLSETTEYYRQQGGKTCVASIKLLEQAVALLRTPAVPADMVERAAEWLSRKYGSDLPLNEKAPDRQKEWREHAAELCAALAAMPGGVDEEELAKIIREHMDLMVDDLGKPVVVGAGAAAKAILSRLHASPGSGWRPIAWLYEDELPKSYPYEAMFPHSAVRDGVRMFPVFSPGAQSDEATLELLAECYARLNDHYWEASGSPEEPPGPGDEWSYNIIPLFTAIQRATGKDHAELMALGNTPPTAQEG